MYSTQSQINPEESRMYHPQALMLLRWLRCLLPMLLWQPAGLDAVQTKMYAAYNGGPGANGSSADCPGLIKWECVRDSPGCYGTEKNDCTPNTGYVETRNYVKKINNVAKFIH